MIDIVCLTCNAVLLKTRLTYAKGCCKDWIHLPIIVLPFYLSPLLRS